jgi:hypothetical protein
MILTDGARWKKIVFHRVDAVRVSSTAGDGRETHGIRRMRHGEELPTEAQVVTNGWDREHCEHCNTHNDPGDYAYMKTDNLWVCITCFENQKTVSLVDDL